MVLEPWFVAGRTCNYQKIQEKIQKNKTIRFDKIVSELDIPLTKNILKEAIEISAEVNSPITEFIFRAKSACQEGKNLGGTTRHYGKLFL